MKTTFRHTQVISTRQIKARQELTKGMGYSALRAKTFVSIIRLLLGM